MKNSGFTLIELLGVIVILTILSLITVPIIDRSLNKGKQGLLDVQEKQIIKGFKNYYADHLDEFNFTDKNKICKWIDDVKIYGYLPSNIVDPTKNDKNNTDNFNSMCVCASKYCTEGGDGCKIMYSIESTDCQVSDSEE